MPLRLRPLLRPISINSEHDLPLPVLKTLLAYRAGIDLRTRMSKPTFYRYRTQLLEHRVDIAQPYDPKADQARQREMCIQPLSPPDFYFI